MRVLVTTRQGVAVELQPTPGDSLMSALHTMSDGVEGVCGGQTTCGTCHVFVNAGWLDRLPAPNEEEAALLDMLEHAQETSRLSCQIVLVDDLDGLDITLAPEE